jgi:mannose-6-phosphate isomerase-like protein (cupin superfamily)
MMFANKHLPERPDAVAPDGSEVRLLLAGRGGGLAHFQLDSGQTSVAVRHRTVDEIWYFLSGRGVMWRRDHRQEEEVMVGPGEAITIPVGTHFQFRSLAQDEPLAALGVTMPPWPGDGEAIRCDGRWPPTVRPGPGLAEA